MEMDVVAVSQSEGQTTRDRDRRNDPSNYLSEFRNTTTDAHVEARKQLRKQRMMHTRRESDHTSLALSDTRRIQVQSQLSTISFNEKPEQLAHL